MGLSKIHILKFRGNQFWLPLLFFLLFTTSLLANTIIIENNSNNYYYLYEKPILYKFNDNLVKVIEPKSIDSITNCDNWYRLRNDTVRNFNDILLGKTPKKIVISSSDSISIYNIVNDFECLSLVDSLIYYSNENYLNLAIKDSLKKAVNFKDTLDILLSNYDLISPLKMTHYVYLLLNNFCHSDFYLEETINIEYRKEIVIKMIESLLVKSYEDSENLVTKIINKIKIHSPKLLIEIRKNRFIDYYIKNIKFYTRLSDFIDEYDIKVDSNKTNIFYFTGSWCGHCLNDLKKLTNQNYNLDNVKIFIIAYESNKQGQNKIKEYLKNLNLDYFLFIMETNTFSKANIKLGVQAIPQIYLYDDEENSKQIEYFLSDYLKQLEN